MIGHYDQQTKMAMRIADLRKRLAAYEADDSYAALRDYYERRIGIGLTRSSSESTRFASYIQ